MLPANQRKEDASETARMYAFYFKFCMSCSCRIIFCNGRIDAFDFTGVCIRPVCRERLAKALSLLVTPVYAELLRKNGL